MLQQVSLKQATEFAFQTLKANLVPFMTSSPGLGKSAAVRQLAKRFNLKLIDVRLAEEDPTCLSGFPTVVDGRSTYAPPLRFPLQGDPIPEGYSGFLLFFDEINSAPRSVVSAAYKIVLDRMIGQEHLHDKVRIIAAGNFSTDNAIVNDMGTAMRSRMVHIHVTTHAENWLDYAAKDGFDTRVVSYLNYQSSKINNFRGFEGSSDETFACERTWEFVSKILKANYPDETKPVPADVAPLLVGTVGSTAYEFVTYTEAFKDLPTIQQVLANPCGCALPVAPAVCYLMTGMLVGNATMDNADKIATYVDRLPKEFAMVFIKLLWGKSDKFLSVPKVAELLDKVADILIK
jgi:MoxR-like ATPase